MMNAPKAIPSSPRSVSAHQFRTRTTIIDGFVQGPDHRPRGGRGRLRRAPKTTRRPTMKISDVTLTLFTWSGIPATTYGRHSPRFSGSSELGLLTLRTDEGVEGHAFLGSSSRSAAMDGASLIRFLKPLVMGQDPLERERLWQAMWQRNRATTLRAIGAVDV